MNMSGHELMDAIKQSHMAWGLIDADSHSLLCASSELTRLIKQKQMESGLNPLRDCPEMLARLQQCAQQQRFLAFDSELLHAHIELLPVKAPDGQSAQIQIFWMELPRTSVQAGAAVQQQEAVYRQLVDEFPHNVFLCSPGGEIFWTNKTSNQFKFGADDIADFASTAWIDKIHPDDQDMAFRNFSTGMAVGCIEPYRVRLKKHNGEFEWYLFTGAPMFDEAGKIRHWVGVNINIDKFKRAEEAAEAHTQALYAQINGYVRRLEEAQKLASQNQKQDLLSNLAGSVAHELNNLLFVMGLNAEVLQRRINDEGMNDNLKAVRESIRKAARLSSQLAGFSGRTPQARSVINPTQLIKELQELLRKAAGAEVDLRIAVDAEIANLEADKAYLENSLINLIINARDAVEGRGSVQLSVRNEVVLRDGKSQDYVAFHVTDNGCGIAEQAREQIFNPFYTTKPAGGGAGLGLPMVKSFMESSGGYIDVRSQPAQGSTFSLYFPRSQQAQENNLPAQSLRGEETVMVVEDDPAVREAVAAALCAQGYKIVTANNAEHAILFIQSGIKMDLIVSDVRMPGKHTVLDMIACVEQKLPGMPIIFATGYSADIVVQQGLIKDKYPVLFKPFTAQELNSKVRSLLTPKNAA